MVLQVAMDHFFMAVTPCIADVIDLRFVQIRKIRPAR
jgi:hypothetical protein